MKRIGDVFASIFWRGLLGGYFFLLAGIVWFIKSSYLPALWLDPIFGIYSLCVTLYLLSRFSLSLLYRPARRGPDQLPSVAVVIPAMNEQTAIETTLASIFALDYPQHLLSVFAETAIVSVAPCACSVCESSVMKAVSSGRSAAAPASKSMLMPS